MMMMTIMMRSIMTKAFMQRPFGHQDPIEAEVYNRRSIDQEIYEGDIGNAGKELELDEEVRNHHSDETLEASNEC